MGKTWAAIALGSNLGDRTAHLNHAVGRLSALLDDLRVSTFHETDPVGVPDSQERYLNAAAVGTFAGSASDLLHALQAIEQERGRQRPYAGAPRTLDLDLILFGPTVVDSPALTLPHPRFRERAFVLEPLAEIVPGMRDPVTGLPVAVLLERLKQVSSVRSQGSSDEA